MQALNRLYQGGSGPLTGTELTSLIRGKWGGRSFEARITKRGQRVYLQVSKGFSIGGGRCPRLCMSKQQSTGASCTQQVCKFQAWLSGESAIYSRL